MAESTGALNSRWLHKRRGTTYRIKGWATLQIANSPDDGIVLVLYQSEEDDTAWARPWSEFLDGRFEQLSGPIVADDSSG